MKIYKIAQFCISKKAIIHYSQRLINDTTRENSEYIVRIYKSNSGYHVIAYNEKIGNYPVERYKKSFDCYLNARDYAKKLIRYLRYDLPGIPYEGEREDVKIPQEKEKTVSEPIAPKIEEYDLDAIEDIQAKNKNWYKKAQESEGYYTSRIASNPKTSPEILKKILERGNDDWVSRDAVRNPNCPVYLLEDILKRGKGKDDWVSRSAVRNPNCPVYLLEEILKRGKDDVVSIWAAENPNCPLKLKIQWMQLTGRIGKEDPTKHIIEREEVKEDPDLQKLRDLIR